MRESNTRRGGRDPVLAGYLEAQLELMHWRGVLAGVQRTVELHELRLACWRLRLSPRERGEPAAERPGGAVLPPPAGGGAGEPQPGVP